ncbi:hypothetical protein [Pikeienuella sp. HZG-20]|uniref:hypothetical protein n=1 Tax=Paludibacillus litoralis TaxID=3133267 RepID=UPI0030EB3D9B
MKPDLQLLIVEGDPPELALGAKRGAGATGARRLARALSVIAPDSRFAYVEPWFSDHDPAAVDLAAFDGVAIAGSGRAPDAGEAGAGPVAAFCARAFRAGRPVFGSGRGMLSGAALLGAAVGPGPESGVARGIRPLEHPLTGGRRRRFDAPMRGGEAVARPPSGAEIAAVDAAGAPVALAYDVGGVRFWGCRYQPEATLFDLAFWLKRQAPRAAREIALAAQDPVAHARLIVKHRINADLLDPAYRTTELANWLESLG